MTRTDVRSAFLRRAGPRCAPLALALALAVGCEDGGGDPLAPEGAALRLSLSGLPPLDPAREGTYEVWAVDSRGTPHSLGKWAPGADEGREYRSPVAAVEVEVTVEPPGDTDPGPSAQKLLRGAFRGGRAELSVVGAVTAGNLPLQEHPGQFTMYFSPSDNHLHGFPSHEESGIWLFNIAPRETRQDDGWVRMTQLREGWVYEGWVVRDIDSPGAVWLSYGKFLPDGTGALRSRDDTGWGPYSGVTDFRTAGEEEYPGDDWISNPLGFPLPEGITLPLNLREKRPDGTMRWTHVVTIEPATDRGEEISTERPFLVRPYQDAFAERVEGLPRSYGLPHPITFRPEGLPRGTAEVR